MLEARCAALGRSIRGVVTIVFVELIAQPFASDMNHVNVAIQNESKFFDCLNVSWISNRHNNCVRSCRDRQHKILACNRLRDQFDNLVRDINVKINGGSIRG